MKKLATLVNITSFTATFVAVCAAVFSVTGIAKLFAGAALNVAIMATSLELGKVVSISFLYQHWNHIPKLLKIYLVTSSLILTMITSAGIYGYLSSAYAKVAAGPLHMTAQIQNVQSQIKSVEEDIIRKNNRLDQITSLRTQQENRLDSLTIRSKTGNVTVIKNAQNSLNQADKNIIDLQRDITILSTKRDSLSAISVNVQTNIETNADIGTFVYIAKMLSLPLDTVVKWFTLIIVLVFDPLAVALVVAVNFLIKNKYIDDPIQPSINQVIVNTTVARESSLNILDVVDDEAIESVQPSTQTVVEEIVNPYAHQSDKQYFARGDFDWAKRETWENNPVAVAYYNNSVLPRLSP